MSIVQRIGNALGLRASEPAPLDTIPIDNRAVVLWTRPTTAVRIGAVYSAVSILATAIEQLSIKVERAGQTTDTTPFIAKPDPDITRADWLHELTISLALRGNAYLRVYRDNAGLPTIARVLNPAHVQPWINPQTGRRMFTLADGRDYTTQDIQHLRLLKIPGEPAGLGPIQAAQHELTGYQDLIHAGTSWVAESGSPSGILSTDQQLSKEQRQDLLASWNGVPAGRTRLLSNGLTYTANLISPKDAQFLESRRFSKTEILDLFGIPASLALGVDKGDSQTYSNVSQEWLGFVRFKLMRYVSEIEWALTELTPRGQRIRINLESLLRSDAETRMRIHAAAIEAGIYSTDYARELEHIPNAAAPKEPAHD